MSTTFGSQGRIQEFLERGDPVRGRSPEPSAEGASAGGGSGSLPQKNLKNYMRFPAIWHILEIRMASDIIQNWAFAEQKTVAATISKLTDIR